MAQYSAGSLGQSLSRWVRAVGSTSRVAHSFSSDKLYICLSNKCFNCIQCNCCVTDVRPSQDHRILHVQTVRINLAKELLNEFFPHLDFYFVYIWWQSNGSQHFTEVHSQDANLSNRRHQFLLLIYINFYSPFFVWKRFHFISGWSRISRGRQPIIFWRIGAKLLFWLPLPKKMHKID